MTRLRSTLAALLLSALGLRAYAQSSEPPSLSLRQMGTGGDTRQLIIAHDTLAGEAQRLATWKQQRGRAVLVVRTSEIGAQPTAEQISARIWQEHTGGPPIGSVLLVGGANLIPPYQRFDPESPAGRHATDLYFGAWSDGDYLPVFPVGRLPAATVEQAKVMVDRIMGYAPPPLGAVLFGFDPALAAYAPADAALLQLGGIPAEIVTWTWTTPCDDQVAGSLLAKFHEGRYLAAYYGHGNTTTMNSMLCPRHLNGPAPRTFPVILSGGCFNGEFDAAEPSLAERLLSSSDGAAAVIAATGAGGGFGYTYRFVEGFVGSGFETGELGTMFVEGLREAVQAADAAGMSTGEGSPTKRFVEKEALFGDPELVIRAPAGARNLLGNPGGAEGLARWNATGSVSVDGTDPRFVVRGGGRLVQQVALPEDAAGKYLVVVGRLSSERVNTNGSITGLPYLYGHVMGGDSILAYLQGQDLRSSATRVNAWVGAAGVFRLPAGSNAVRLFLMQAQRADDPQNGSAARFDDLALYVVPDVATANRLVEQHRLIHLP